MHAFYSPLPVRLPARLSVRLPACSMYYMHKKISARERIVGFYSTAPRIRPADLHIDALFRRLPFATPRPVMVLIDVRPDVEGLPVQAYQSVETVVEGRENVRTFAHLPCDVGASEAEEVGVEHLLRDINDPSVSSTAAELRHKLAGLKGLRANLAEISGYLSAVTEGRLPANRDVLYHVQMLLAHLPNTQLPSVTSAMFETVNDQVRERERRRGTESRQETCQEARGMMRMHRCRAPLCSASAQQQPR